MWKVAATQTKIAEERKLSQLNASYKKKSPPTEERSGPGPRKFGGHVVLYVFLVPRLWNGANVP